MLILLISKNVVQSKNFVLGPIEFYEFSLKIDAVSLVGHNITMAQLYEILVESINRNLRLIGSSFENQLEVQDMKLRLPEPMHFKPLNFGHLLTLVYPIGTSASETGMCTIVYKCYTFNGE